MKKIYALLTSVLFFAAVLVSIFPANAQVPIENMGDWPCYSTYDNGTTNFTECAGCSDRQGSRLEDKGKCAG